MFTPSSCNDIGIRKFDFVVKTQFLIRTGFKQNLESLPSALFPKLWNAIEIDLKETKNLVVYHVSRFYIENYNKNLNVINILVFVYPPSFTPCILVYLYSNLSDLTLPQIT